MTTLAYAARAPRPDQQTRTHALHPAGEVLECGAEPGVPAGPGPVTDVDCQACRVALHASGDLEYLRTPAHRR